MKYTNITKRFIIFTALITLLFTGTGVQACGKANLSEAKASKGSGSTYSSGISTKEKCIVTGCSKRRKKGFAYCSDHKCCIYDCPSQQLSTDIYCQSHHDAFKKNRSRYTDGTTTGTSSKKSSTGKSTTQNDYYGTKKYKNAEDFADDWEDDFEDYDDAYDYYEEVTGHY